ncbi:hypothetical protein RRG08_057538 [Elysia crispata]|uniref:Uncharacterized protein n=1 Tax=Elysia crispata TaxID=231223 RepID=A0AAE1ABG9_9GAST|nr:hypothetical protein RRG08_057538 [Elysia crispata]
MSFLRSKLSLAFMLLCVLTLVTSVSAQIVCETIRQLGDAFLGCRRGGTGTLACLVFDGLLKTICAEPEMNEGL